MKVGLIVPYFGKWPEWISYFMLSAGRVKNVVWFVFTDCGAIIHPANVVLKHLSFADYLAMASDKLGFGISLTSPYKLCDLRPAYGEIHRDLLRDFLFFGYTDLDVIYGDLDDYLLSRIEIYDVISAQETVLSGHLTLLKNNERNRSAYLKIPNFSKRLAMPGYEGMEEHDLAKIYLASRRIPNIMRHMMSHVSPYFRRLHFKEMYTTPLYHGPWIYSQEHPIEFTWNKGIITSEISREYSYPYVHFMNWISSRYLPAGVDTPAWQREGQGFIEPFRKDTQSFRISESGLHIL